MCTQCFSGVAVREREVGHLGEYPKLRPRMARPRELSQTSREPARQKPRQLAARELGIAALLARGLSTWEVAEEFGISVRTVKWHLTNAFKATGTKDRLCLVLWFFQQTAGDQIAASIEAALPEAREAFRTQARQLKRGERAARVSRFLRDMETIREKFPYNKAEVLNCRQKSVCSPL